MARRWHVKENGDMGICQADPGRCPFQSEGAVHFSNSEDAIARSEEIYESQLGLLPGSEESTDVPSRDEFYEELLSYESIVDRVDPGGYILFRETVYRVNSFEETEGFNAKINAVDTETGEPEEIYLDFYNRDGLMLRGDGPLDPADPDSYDVEWDVSAYMGSYINRGDSFLYDGKIYRANDWEWSRALLRTEIEAYDESTGGLETITIHQGSERDVKFLKGTKYS